MKIEFKKNIEATSYEEIYDLTEEKTNLLNSFVLELWDWDKDITIAETIYCIIEKANNIQELSYMIANLHLRLGVLQQKKEFLETLKKNIESNVITDKTNCK